jgi:branched-chain amino acid aminotransferase
MKITITQNFSPKEKPSTSALGFGKIFTDHMFVMDYSPDEKWHNPRIEPYAPLALDPAVAVLHYAQSIFEGLKAFITEKGAIQLFRPRENIRRLNDGCKKLVIPQVDEDFVLQALKQLLIVEKDWIPNDPETALYIRPLVIATDPFLGVSASKHYKFLIILSPVGRYYVQGFKPIKIQVSTDYVRAVKGGTGNIKTPGNYAASLYAHEIAKKNGCDQVLWLDAIERKYVEEVGVMNIFFIIDGQLITPELNGSILPGITRDSIICLAKQKKMAVCERKIGIDEIFNAQANGSLQEVFGSGTAAVVSTVGTIKYKDKNIIINDGKIGKQTKIFYNLLTGIQYGKISGPDNWIEFVE